MTPIPGGIGPLNPQTDGLIAMAETAPNPDKAPITIKKYANRRLYNTSTSSYVTLDHLCQMVKDGIDFVVFDAKTGEDITRSVLTQIIVEEESKGGQNLLPINFLRQLISFYGDNLQFLLPRYLEQSMDSFALNQEQMRKYLQESFGGMFPFSRFEELGKQNMAFLEQAMRMWNPFKAATDKAAADKAAGDNAGGGASAAKPAAENLDLLKAQMDALQRQFEALTRQKKEG
jgi:polyhydroxyalkanoate synthesis repressor PhaR